MSLKYEQFAQRLKDLVSNQRALTFVFVDDNEKTAYEADLIELASLSRLWDKVAEADTVDKLKQATQDLEAFHKAKKFSSKQIYPSILGPASLDLATKYQALLVEAKDLEPTATFNNPHDNFFYTIVNPIPEINAEINRRNQLIAEALKQLRLLYNYSKSSAPATSSTTVTPSAPATSSTSTGSSLQSPAASSITSSPALSGAGSVSGNEKVFIEKNVENPGGGDCAFYSFAIGLIDIAQKNPGFLEQWIDRTPEVIELAEDIRLFDVTKAVSNKHSPGFQFLNRLQRLLRGMVHEHRLDDLRLVWVSDNYKQQLERDPVFLYFAELHYKANKDFDPRTNPFWGNNEIKKRIDELGDKIAALKKESSYTQEVEESLVAQEFVRLLYGDKLTPEQIKFDTPFQDNSPVIKALSKVLEKTFWGTRDDLMVLGAIFQFNMHVIEVGKKNHKMVGIPGQHTITLNNHGNYHWTTKIQVEQLKKDVDAAKKPPQKAPPAPKPKPLKEPDLTPKPSAKPETPKPTVTKKTALKERREEKISPENAQRLADLNAIIAQVSEEYIDYSASTFFHPHWEEGRDRARFFAKSMGNTRDIRQANIFLVQYLENTANGKTWPHSFRTMLLQRLLQTAPDTPSLQQVSEHYAEHLEQLKAKLENPSAAPTPTL